VLFLIFRGPDAVERIRNTVGHILHERTSGETIRDTFGDYITDDSGEVTYFRAGCTGSFRSKGGSARFKALGGIFDSDGGILDRVVSFPANATSRKDARSDQTRQFQVSKSAAGRASLRYFHARGSPLLDSKFIR
jgi:hypothetical protein